MVSSVSLQKEHNELCIFCKADFSTQEKKKQQYLYNIIIQVQLLDQ